MGFKASEHMGDDDNDAASTEPEIAKPGSAWSARYADMAVDAAESAQRMREEANEQFRVIGELWSENQRMEARREALAQRNVEEELEERGDRVEDRAAAAEDRARAAEDRARAAEDREQAAIERAADRELAAQQRTEDQQTATSRFRWQMAAVIIGALISASGVVIALTKDSTVEVQPTPVTVLPAPVVVQPPAPPGP